jgi:predicted lipid-binding transport protein (Tim44 family)
MAAEQASKQLMEGLFGKTGGGDSGGLLGSLFGAVKSGLSGLFGGGLNADISGLIGNSALFANGGIMTGDGAVPLRKYANGGVASSPQLAMFGEGSTPEAYVPLPDGRRIPVAMQNGAGQQVVNNVNVYVSTPNADSFRKSERQIREQMLRAVNV